MLTLLDRVKAVYRECGLLVGLPYVLGGGHNPEFLPSVEIDGRWIIGGPGAGYDCSSGASTGLRAGGLLDKPRATVPKVTQEFLGWGKPSPGRWMTVYVIQTATEEHMAIQFSIATTGFYSQQWWQAANPRVGIGWLPLSAAEIAAATQRHWEGT